MRREKIRRWEKRRWEKKKIIEGKRLEETRREEIGCNREKTIQKTRNKRWGKRRRWNEIREEIRWDRMRKDKTMKRQENVVKDWKRVDKKKRGCVKDGCTKTKLKKNKMRRQDKKRD